MGSKSPKIAMIGECMIELNGSPFSAIHQTLGGDTLNTAVYTARAARLLNNVSPETDSNLTVSYVTGLGTDIISQRMQSMWQAEGIDTDLICEFSNKSPGLYWIILDERGERSFMYWRDQSAAKVWLQHEKSPTILETLRSYDWIYLSGISLAILNEADRSQLLDFLTVYRQQGGKIAFDSNYRKALWSDQAKMRETYKAILSLTDLALLTNEDEMAIWDIQESQILDNLQQFELPVLVLKLGEAGAQIIEKGDINSARLIPAVKVATIVDTTSAGDSFNAGVLASLIAGLSIDASCANGHKVASTVIQYKGAIIPNESMPHLI